MNDVLCPVNPIGHEWDGLGCRWCPATRTPGEAIVSGLASRRGGDRDSARTLLDAHRAEAAAEALHAAADEIDRQVPDDERYVVKKTVVNILRRRANTCGEEAPVDESFFVPGRVYTHTDRDGLHLRFFCEHLTTDPKVGDREAWGWLRRADGTRRMLRAWHHDLPTWTPEAGGGRG